MTIAIVGRTGSGKSFAAKGMVESDLGAGARVCVVDPTGVWWGLRLSPDGQSPGFPVVIFGGEHADVPLAVEHAERLGEMIAAGKVPQSVIDISDMSGGQQTSFLTAFLEALYAKNRTPLTLVLDEADIMAPQNPLPEQRRLQGATNKIVRRGRVKGFRPIMITQRPAVLDKSVLSQIDTLIAMRLTSPQDRKAIEEWVKGNADGDQARAVLDSLASLPRGEGWFWAPAEDVLERKRFPMITTFDSGRTPEPGEASHDVAPLALPDMEAIRAVMQVVNVERKPAGGAGAPVRTASAAEITAAEQRGYERGLADGDRRGFVRGVEKARHAFAEAVNQLSIGEASVTAQITQVLPPEEARARARVLVDASRRAQVAAAPAQPNPKNEPKRQPGESGTLNSAAKKMLAVLDTNPPARLTWVQVATLAGLRASGGHFNAGRKGLRDSLLVVDEGDLVLVTNPSDGARPAVRDPGAVVDIWASALSGAAPKILRYLHDVGGSADRNQIAGDLGMKPTGGHWNSAWKELRDNHVVKVEGPFATLTELFTPLPRRQP